MIETLVLFRRKLYGASSLTTLRESLVLSKCDKLGMSESVCFGPF